MLVSDLLPFQEIIEREQKRLLGKVLFSLKPVATLDKPELSNHYWLPLTPEFGILAYRDGSVVELYIQNQIIPTEAHLATFLSVMIYALGLSLDLQGHGAFHANGIGVQGQGVALVGHSGRGKSTLTAYALQQGATFITDDVVAVDRQGWTTVGYPRLKLYSHTTRELGLAQPQATPHKIHHHPQALGLSLQREALPLRVIYLLEESTKDVYTVPLSPITALYALLEHTYYARYLIPTQPEVLDTYIQLVERVKVYQLYYPRCFDRLPEVYACLVQAVADLSPTVSK